MPHADTEHDEVLLQLVRAVIGISTRAADGLGVSVVQLRALTVLSIQQREANLGRLAEGMGVAVSTASRLVDRLVRAGFVDRRPSAVSRREVSLVLTPAGRDLLDRYDGLRLRSLRTGLDEVPTGARRDIVHALAVYSRALGEPAPQEAPTVSEDGDERVGDDEGGDPACWLRRVCPACGRLADEDPPTRCPACGAELADD